MGLSRRSGDPSAEARGAKVEAAETDATGAVEELRINSSYIVSATAAFQRTTCGSKMAMALPCVVPYRAVTGFAHAWVAPSIESSMAVPA